MAVERSGSILAADFGNVNTRAILIDLVDGEYRLVARGETRSTGDFPIGDVRASLARVCEQITGVTGRKLISEQGQMITPEQPDRSGVDHFIATASTGRSLRTALVGLVPEVSLASGQRAAAGTYVEIVEALSLDDARDEEDQLNALIASRPDLIFITGGTEGGAQEPVLALARTAQLAVKLVQQGKKPAVLYAGNSQLVPRIQAMFDGLATVFVSPNVRPTLDEEELEAAQLQLGLAFDAQQARRGAGYDRIGQMSRLGVLPTAQSYQIITEYLGQALKGNVLLVDVGSAVSTLSASVNGRVTTSIRTDIGLGHSAESLVALVGEKGIERWLPFVTAPNQVRHYTLNKALRPGGLPETLRGLYIEHALLRAGIGALLEASRPTWSKQATPQAGDHGLMPPFQTVIGAGAGLTRTGNPGFNALLLLDSIQPTGVTQLQTDPYGLVAALGALARVNPEAVVQVIDSGALERLGTSISLSGQPAAGRTALRVKITTSDGEVIKQEVLGGGLWVYPLGTGKSAAVEVRAAGRGVNIGGRRRVRLTVEGGAAGLIFDARGRPLPVGTNARARAAQFPLWISQATGMAVKPIDEGWLQKPDEEGNILDDASRPTRAGLKLPTPKQPKPRRGGLFGRRAAKPARAAGDDAIPLPDIELEEEPVEEKDEFQSELDELRGR